MYLQKWIAKSPFNIKNQHLALRDVKFTYNTRLFVCLICLSNKQTLPGGFQVSFNKALTIIVKAQLMEHDAIHVKSLAHHY